MNEACLVGRKYSEIYADLPWDDKDWTQTKIKEMPVQTWTAPEALVPLWIPMSLLPSGLILLSLWGFDYAGMLVWRKLKDDLEDTSLYGECEFMLVGKIGQAKLSTLLLQNV
jgi:N6-adenosine-specific RNA methylase IME4